MLDIIFIHIHKTGGKSLSAILQEVYGRKTTFRLNQNVFRGSTPDEIDLRELFPDSTKILSGHLPYPFLREIVEQDNPRLITWLRDPVERVLSNYYWRLNLDRSHKLEQTVKPGKDITLEEFIHIPKNQNRMSTFLEGLSLKDLYFLGMMETYDRDLESLAQKLGWKKVPRIHTNINPTFIKEPRQVSPDLRSEMIRLNALDIELYQEALSLQLSINQSVWS
ncbi:MAG: sulfotransferase family protein [Saprospiraceae bacterium]|nr:sulfotransferase family protein [Saprospiraceae bacterium]